MGNDVFLSPTDMDRKVKTIRSIAVEELIGRSKLDFIYFLSSMSLYLWNPLDKNIFERAAKVLRDKKIKEKFLTIANNFLKLTTKERIMKRPIDEKKRVDEHISEIVKKYRISDDWKSCKICNPISHDSDGFWVGGEFRGGDLHTNTALLEIVGAPHFNDSTSYRHWCLKKCSKCKSHYLWECNYEFLVPASEDEIWLTRLSEIEKERWLEVVEEYIKKNKSLSRQV